MFSEKYGIVTGASRGLGAAVAEELAREGYGLIITYQGRVEKALEVKEQLEKEFNVRVETYKLVVQNEDEVIAFRKWAEETMGTNLSVLVNSAGIFANAPADQIDPKLFCDVIDVNVKGTFFVCRYFCDMMIANHFGKIVNFCSAVGLRATAGSVAYASSKFAVRGMTQAMAVDLGPHNIQVNAIAPGPMKTEMTIKSFEINPDMMNARVKSSPLQRLGEVSEMYHIIRYFMASDFITGQVVSMNGGNTMV